MSSVLKGLYRFDEFELNPSERTFSRNRTPILVSPKAFEVLACLVRNPRRVVTKDELLKAVWPDSFVEESNLTQHISLLRKALGAKSNYIVTIPGRGYQFTAKVQTVTSAGMYPERQPGEIVVQRVRERTRVLIEESSPRPPADLEPVSNASPAASLDITPNRWVAPKRGRWRAVAAISALAVVVIVAGYFIYKPYENVSIRPATSIAVLPFTNLTGDPAKEYLSDGLTEEMINGLARVNSRQLRVIARTSSMSYKSTKKTVRQIAQELGVQYVLEGSVQCEGNHLHATAQLIRGGDQTHLWADTFDGDASQILEFERRLTDSVARSLSLALSAEKTTEHTPPNSAAHDAYLQGLYSLSQRSRSGFESALRSLGTAVAEDPEYGRAYAELAVTYNLMGQYTWMDPLNAHSQGKAAALQALATDPGLAEAHAALGFNQWFYEWNSAAAEKELLQAIQSEPTNVDARHWYAMVLMTSARLGEAAKQMRAALALDPKAPILRTNLGWLHYLERQYPLAIQEMQGVANDNPDFVTAHYKLWWAYSVTGDTSHAWKELQAVAHLIFSPVNEEKIVTAYQQEGYTASLKTLVAFASKDYSQSFVDDARCMTFAGDKAAALKFLERALKFREGWMVLVETDPAFDSLRSAPEYSRLVRELRTISDSSSRSLNFHTD
jgi:TolB-like protein/DNA-binding winged helix-turn-helix (wHTH) protein/Flp pilus assembly protein TadD